jgi:hypothetical protein
LRMRNPLCCRVCLLSYMIAFLSQGNNTIMLKRL